jgi:hypothetical protein
MGGRMNQQAIQSSQADNKTDVSHEKQLFSTKQLLKFKESLLKRHLTTCTKKAFILYTAFILSVIEAFAAEDKFPSLYKPQPVKIIFIGYDSPSAREMRENIKDMEKNIPGDGVAIRLNTETTQNGKKLVLDNNFFMRPDKPVWKKEWLKPLVTDLKACKSEKLTDNFLLTATYPGKVDWFDDKEWKRVCEKFAVIAWAAKQGGCKGIILDCEDYGGNHLFHYSHKSGHSFKETWNKVRQRGQELITAICKEYPDITIFTFFWFGGLLGTEHFDTHNEGLLIPFANGVYDKISPEAEIVDGYEAGYTLTYPGDFFAARKNFDHKLKYLCHPENVRTVRNQTSLSIPLYLDAYVNREGRWTKTVPKGMTRLGLFKRNLSLALQNSGKYVWLYGEQGKWWNKDFKDYPLGARTSLPKTFGKGRMWEKIMPGITHAVRSARNPMECALLDLKNDKLKNNLVKNGNFENKFKYWNTFAPGMRHRDRGKAEYGKFALRICNSCDIKLKQSINVNAGKSYLVCASWRTMLAGKASILLVPYNSQGKKLAEIKLVDNANCSAWRQAADVIKFPKGTNKVSLELRLKSQSGIYRDRAYFDEVAIYELPNALSSVSTNKALAAMRQGKLGKSLVFNGGFELDDAVSGWQTVKSGDFISSSDEFTEGQHSALLRYMRRATLRQIIPVKPMDSLFFVADCKPKGKVSPEVYIQWKSLDNKWLKQNVRITFDEDLGNGWKRACKIINVPPGVGYFGLHVIMVSANPTPENMCYFDNIRLHKLSGANQ